MINAILACDRAGGIARNGLLPWPKNSVDLQWFRRHTRNGVVVMGRNTWQSDDMPAPLPGRINAVVSTLHQKSGDEIIIFKNINSNIKLLSVLHPRKQVWVIGGAKLLMESYNIIDNFYLTIIDGDYNCDTHIPLDKILNDFKIDQQEDHTGLSFYIMSRAL